MPTKTASASPGTKSAKVKPIPTGYHAITPYLIIDGAARAIEFYRRAFDAKEMLRIPAPNDRIGHAEIKVGDSVIMLADEHPEMDASGHKTVGGAPVSLHVYVEDADAVFERAIEGGAKALREVEDKFLEIGDDVEVTRLGYTSSVDHLKENVAAVDLELTAEELARLDEASEER
jgi:PhnB protein